MQIFCLLFILKPITLSSIVPTFMIHSLVSFANHHNIKCRTWIIAISCILVSSSITKTNKQELKSQVWSHCTKNYSISFQLSSQLWPPLYISFMEFLYFFSSNHKIRNPTRWCLTPNYIHLTPTFPNLRYHNSTCTTHPINDKSF